MWMRNACISLLVAAVCLQAAVADDQVLSLLKTAREASSLGKYDDAEQYVVESSRRLSGCGKVLKDALQLMERLDRRDPYRARLLNNLGAFYYLMGAYARAEKMFKQSIAFIEKERGPDRLELVPSLTNLGGLYVVRKRWNDATALFERALRLLANSAPANHPDVAAVLDNFGLLDLARNNLLESEEALRRAYAIRLEALGRKHPHVARTAAHLAAALTAAGEYSAAEVLGRRRTAVGTGGHGCCNGSSRKMHGAGRGSEISCA